MLYQALATDYDGTIATEGRVDETTIVALKRWQQTGRKLILVTGRRLDNLDSVFPQTQLFDCIVAENGALLSFPATGEQRLLGSAPPQTLIKILQQRQVPFSLGQGIISTRIPHDQTVAEVIQELGLAWQISYNKGAVMLLPKGVDKDTGLTTALNYMDLSSHTVVGVGDGENDLSLLLLCGLAVSVANALPSLKAHSDWVMSKNSGEGVVELIEKLLSSKQVNDRN